LKSASSFTATELKLRRSGKLRAALNEVEVVTRASFFHSVVELCQSFLGDREGGSGLSVLRTFRLLRILKLVRFMPNLRRQLFVMLRTMDNVAVFFALLILFIFIFRYVCRDEHLNSSTQKPRS